MYQPESDYLCVVLCICVKYSVLQVCTKWCTLLQMFKDRIKIYSIAHFNFYNYFYLFILFFAQSVITASSCVSSHVHRGASWYDCTQRSGCGDGLLLQRSRDALIFSGDPVVVHQEPSWLDRQTALDDQWSRSMKGTVTENNDLEFSVCKRTPSTSSFCFRLLVQRTIKNTLLK